MIKQLTPEEAQRIKALILARPAARHIRTSKALPQAEEATGSSLQVTQPASCDSTEANNSGDSPNRTPEIVGKVIDYPRPDSQPPPEAKSNQKSDRGPQAIDAAKAMSANLLAEALLIADRLHEVHIPERENLCGTWMKQGDLGYVFGPRGIGKTWLTALIGRRLAEGKDIGPWRVAKRRRVLYVDGEMPLDGMRQRDTSLRTENGDFMVLNHEWLFQKTNCVLNLTGPKTQEALLTLCMLQEVDVLILDNLSCLFSGVAENDADSWELVLPWLLDLRRHRNSAKGRVSSMLP